MNFFDFFKPSKPAIPNAPKPKRDNLVVRVVKKLFAPRPKPAEEKPAPAPTPARTTQEQRAQMRANAEAEAMKRATNILIESLQHPDDAGWNEARRRAKEFIDRSTGLVGKGALQDKNRQRVAERYINDQLSTVEGIDERKESRRAQFNANMGTNFSGNQWDTVERILDSKSFKKLKELFVNIPPSELIALVMKPLSEGATVDSVERTVDVFSRENIPPEFDIFDKVVNMNDAQFMKFSEVVNVFNTETDFTRWDDHDIAEAFYSMAEGVIQDETLQNY